MIGVLGDSVCFASCDVPVKHSTRAFARVSCVASMVVAEVRATCLWSIGDGRCFCAFAALRLIARLTVGRSPGLTSIHTTGPVRPDPVPLSCHHQLSPMACLRSSCRCPPDRTPCATTEFHLSGTCSPFQLTAFADLVRLRSSRTATRDLPTGYGWLLFKPPARRLAASSILAP